MSIEKIKLATTSTVTSTFVGDGASTLIADMLLSGTTLAGDYFTVMPDVKLTTNLQRINSTNIIQADSAPFSPTSTITIDERSITPFACKVNLELPKTLFESSYLSKLLKPGANNSTIPDTLGGYIVDYFGKLIGADVEKAIWQGNVLGSTGNVALDSIDGIITRGLKYQSGCVVVAPTTITLSNVIAELTKVYNAIPDTILHEPDVHIFVSNTVAKLYKQAVAAQNFSGYYTNNPELVFIDVPLVAVNGMPTNNMCAATTRNLVFGTDLISDMNEIKVKDMSDITLDNTIRYGAKFKIGVNFVWEKEVVIYGTALLS
jgi:hypothetical protein